jgi:hypothetical protein
MYSLAPFWHGTFSGNSQLRLCCSSTQCLVGGLPHAFYLHAKPQVVGKHTCRRSASAIRSRPDCPFASSSSMRWLLRVIVGILQQARATTFTPAIKHSSPSWPVGMIVRRCVHTQLHTMAASMAELKPKNYQAVHAHMSGVPVLRALPMSRAYEVCSMGTSSARRHLKHIRPSPWRSSQPATTRTLLHIPAGIRPFVTVLKVTSTWSAYSAVSHRLGMPTYLMTSTRTILRP